MRKLLTGVAILALGVSITACDRPERADNADVAADANADVMVDANAAMDANVAVDANAVDANAMDANATNNVTEQGSTDH